MRGSSRKRHMERESIWDKDLERRSPGFLPASVKAVERRHKLAQRIADRLDGMAQLAGDAELTLPNGALAGTMLAQIAEDLRYRYGVEGGNQ